MSRRTWCYRNRWELAADGLAVGLVVAHPGVSVAMAWVIGATIGLGLFLWRRGWRDRT